MALSPRIAKIIGRGPAAPGQAIIVQDQSTPIDLDLFLTNAVHGITQGMRDAAKPQALNAIVELYSEARNGADITAESILDTLHGPGDVFIKPLEDRDLAAAESALITALTATRKGENLSLPKQNGQART